MEEKYLQSLVEHEMSTYFKEYCKDSRQAMILLGGVALNFMGDLLGNPESQFTHMQIKISDIILTGTNPEVNTIVLDMAERDPIKLGILLRENKEIKKVLGEFASQGTETILAVKIDNVKYKVFDGMHRIIGHILAEKEYIDAYVLENYGEFFPKIEAHVVYDIIKAFQRSDKTLQDEQDCIGALRLLVKNTKNSQKILQERFDIKHLPDSQVQSLITQALK
ncbi:hypothetical protein N9J72_01935 [Candidatus Gracilibacteria bacterium]|nr:hypothetical protein [Candidatus Gracilibacteria bacterium]